MDKTEEKAHKLTRKRKAFADEILNNPETTITKAAQKAGYSPKTAYSIGSELLKKPEIMAYLNSHATEAEQVLIEAMKAKRAIYKFNPETKYIEHVADEDDHAIRIRAADSILDRVHGKAVAKIEQRSTKVQIKIDLTGNTN